MIYWSNCLIREKDVNICNEFDNYMRELFEVEPPLG